MTTNPYLKETNEAVAKYAIFAAKIPAMTDDQLLAELQRLENEAPEPDFTILAAHALEFEIHRRGLQERLQSQRANLG